MPFPCSKPFNGVPVHLQENLNFLPWPISPYMTKFLSHLNLNHSPLPPSQP